MSSPRRYLGVTLALLASTSSLPLPQGPSAALGTWSSPPIIPTPASSWDSSESSGTPFVAAAASVDPSLSASSSSITSGTTPLDGFLTVSSAGLGLWAVGPNFTNMDDFSVSSYAAGSSNIAVIEGSPASLSDPNLNGTGPSISAQSAGEAMDELWSKGGGGYPWESASNSIQILYPANSINPGNSPQGGTEFYAHPIDVRAATNASLEYSVYFPPDFAFVKGGKLPGLYGGHPGCSGGDAAVE